MSLKKKISNKLLNLFNINTPSSTNNDQSKDLSSSPIRPGSPKTYKSVLSKLLPNITKRDSLVHPITIAEPPSPTLSTLSHITTSSDSSQDNNHSYHSHSITDDIYSSDLSLTKSNEINESLSPIPISKVSSSPIYQLKKSPLRLRSNSHSVVPSHMVSPGHNRSQSSNTISNSSDGNESIKGSIKADIENKDKSPRKMVKKSPFSSNLSHLFKAQKHIEPKNKVDFLGLDLDFPNSLQYKPVVCISVRRKSVLGRTRVEAIEEYKAMKVFNHLKLIKSSILEGQHLTAKLFLPKEIWNLTWVHLSDLDFKTDRLEKLKLAFQAFSKLDLSDINSVKEALDNIAWLIHNFQTKETKSKVKDKLQSNDGSGNSESLKDRRKSSFPVLTIQHDTNVCNISDYAYAITQFVISCKHLEYVYTYLTSQRNTCSYPNKLSNQITNLLHRVHCVTNYLLHVVVRDLIADIETLVDAFLLGIMEDARE